MQESEDKLWLFLIALIIMPSGLILWGVGGAHGIPWIGLCIGALLLGITISFGVLLSVQYTVDSYKRLGSEAMVTVILVRNCMSFGLGYAIDPWIDGMGLQNCFITAACVCIVFIGTFLPMIYFGKASRVATRARYIRFLATSTGH